jgi:eukaryotic-like serine/threonine-protein kinase
MLGKYRLIAELGRGGMAEVFLALANPGKPYAKLVVIKKPREHLASDAEFMTMLVDEARIAARLNHPNLVQTLEVDESNGQEFLTMEYLDGQPLHRILSRARSVFPLDMHISVLIDVCTGIHHAHELRDFDGTPLDIIHRDVTPHNVFVTYEGQVKVVDFGIAKAVGRAGETRHGVVKGKVPYMAPEQAAGRQLDRRVDIFSVGVMCFEAAVRRRMWKGVSEIDVIRRLVAGNIPSSPRAVDANVDVELDYICQRALAAAPEDRYATAAEMQHDLEAYLATKGPRPPARAIGAYCAKLFSDKRAMTNKVIETQLADLKKASASPPVVPVEATNGGGPPPKDPVRPSSVSAVKPQMVRKNQEHESKTIVNEPQSEGIRAVRSLAVAALSKRYRALMLLCAVVLALTTAVLTVVSLLPHASSQAQPVSNRGSVTLTLRATPLETRFIVDKGPPLDNPFIGKFPRDGQEHTIQAVAPGYASNQEAVVFQSDVSLRFNLAPLDRSKKSDK